MTRPNLIVCCLVVYTFMASAIMTFLSNNKLKLAILIILIIILIQTVRYIPWLHSLQGSDIDHGPSPEGALTPVSIAVFYEALCPDSKNFVIRQLKPVVERAPKLVSTKFYPYGKAKTMEDKYGNITFTCQHGPTECLANKVHACGVKLIEDQGRQTEYVACMIADNYDPVGAGRSCASKLGIDWDPIYRCTVEKEGSLLLKRNGELTAALRPRASFIPTVLLDDGQWVQSAILKNLLKEVCSHFKQVTPDECKNVPDGMGRS